MGKYIITTGQNLYDIAMHLYGSIEGIVDLLILNPQLSLEDKLAAGNELEYTDDFIINGDVIAYNKAHGLIPAGGERHVYPKQPSLPKIMEFHLPPKKTSAGFVCSGTGKMEIDWGDNTRLEQQELGERTVRLHHNFDDAVADKHKIRLYGGNLLFRELDLTDTVFTSGFFLQPVSVEKFTLARAVAGISFLSLLRDTYDIDLSGISTTSLLPLLKQKGLLKLDLTGAHVKTAVVDEFLIELIRQYEQRHNCYIMLTTQPSGSYREPSMDENGNYILATGMEAVWVLTHELSWNEAGYWKIQINNDLYTTEP